MTRPKEGVTFWDRVRENTVSLNYSCNIFVGNVDECGYGRIHKDKKLVRIHRARWEEHNGPIPDGMCVCHTCDEPACHNIDHLFLGTHKENMEDKSRKGRVRAIGEENSSAKLNVLNVLEIKKRLSNGDTSYSIARDYGVKGETVLNIKNGHSWKHVK